MQIFFKTDWEGFVTVVKNTRFSKNKLQLLIYYQKNLFLKENNKM